LLADALRQPLPDQPCDNIDGAARGEADDDLDRTCGIIIRRSGDRQARERRRTRRQMQEFSAEKFHNYSPRA